MNVHIIGFVFISIVGTLLHFTYDWSKHNKVVAVFSAVNESTWEHIKMGLTAYYLWMIIDGFLCGETPNYFLAKLIGTLAIIIVMPFLFYGYKIFTKKAFLILDISIFYITIVASQYASYHIMSLPRFSYPTIYISIILTFVVFGFYILMTFMPIKNFIFKDPITKEYGLKGHK